MARNILLDRIQNRTKSMSPSGIPLKSQGNMQSRSPSIVPRNTPNTTQKNASRTVGASGKDYVTGSNGSITVTRPDGSSSTVNKGDVMYDKTVNAMGNDGVKFPSSSSGSSNKPSSNKPSSGGSSSSSSSDNSSGGGGNNIVAGTGGMTQSQYNAEVQRKKQAGIGLTNQAVFNAMEKKSYVTSKNNQAQYGNNTSTHMMKQAGDKSWVSDQYGKDDKGTYVLKQGNANNKVYMTDANKQYFANNYGGTAGFDYDDKNKVTYKSNTQDMRTDSMYGIYGDVGTNSAEKQALKQTQEERFKNMTSDELQAYKNASTSQLEKNFISTIDGTMANDDSYNFAPIAFTPQEMQTDLTDMIYAEMRKSGIENFAGLDTKTLNEVINKTGLGGLFDINQVNSPFLQEQMMAIEADRAGGTAEFRIDQKQLMDTLANSGALKEGYIYDEKTGQIGVDKNYTQVGDILMDKGEATRWYGNQEGHAEQRARQEDIDNQMYEEPLEWRAKHNPESMTPEMQEDLQMERDIKSQLEQLTLELQYIEEQEGGTGVPMVLGGGIGGGAGSGAGNGSGNNGNGSGNGMYGNGGDSTYQGITGGGKGAVYGTSQNYTNANSTLLNAMKRRM